MAPVFAIGICSAAGANAQTADYDFIERMFSMGFGFKY
jgi:hypothetical protein